MDFEYDYYKRSHVPAFGSWEDWNNDLPFTQCFETATKTTTPHGFLRYSYSDHEQDRDLYFAQVTPAVIVVPRRRRAKLGQGHVEKGIKDESWVVHDEPRKPTPKPVDEDLYRISPELLSAKPKKKRGFGFFSSCLLCVS